MRRREFLGFVCCGVASPLVARAQHSGKVHRLGQLSAGPQASRKPLLDAFMEGMRGLGYVEGQNFIIEHRYADGVFERLPKLAEELISWQPDALLVSTTPGNLAAKRVTTSVPIVMVGVADPVGVGLVASLSRPGGNITGITNIGAELAAKRVELLKEIVPAITKIAVLIHHNDQNASLQLNSAKAAAEKLGIKLDPVLHVAVDTDLKATFEAAVRSQAGAAIRMIDPLQSAFRKQTVVYAAAYQLPTIYPFREDVLEGGLISYGPSLPDQYRQAATFVHKIFNGAKPAELPVEQPVKFELIINLRAAKALGIAVPPTLLARADEVIE